MAPYACHPARSRGRLHPEPPSRLRDAFARDRDRVIHATAFRRLRHKTQVFVAPEGDHFRVRLTHSLEVAQIARTLARVLQVNEDLTEVVALAHDVGHPPFGHAGEEALARAMAPFGGFDHNGHALRVLTRLEYRTPAWPGLNLSWEVLEGLAKHNGPMAHPGWALAEVDREWPLDLETHPGLEAQLAALADDIAYCAHDLDDGIRAGLVDVEEAAAAVPLVERLWQGVRQTWPQERESQRLVPPLIRDLIGEMVDALLAETRARLQRLAPEFPDDVRRAGEPLVAFPEGFIPELERLRAFLAQRVYRAAPVDALKAPAARVVTELLDAYRTHPDEMPPRWRPAPGAEATAVARAALDYVAGMTDRFAAAEHARLTGMRVFPPDLPL
ncbi:MAG: deoxyguanosinetriphosphate triphosphohydrolase [Sphingomonadaceae bacterium]|uniref:deoxyguanosinetriphosphate triphosphohydrolase n=1 Tax=Thermaurantiacus sp. TaxID=2820283 RepID=UPI00298EFDF4|nr:deoxyguanosinetriphosphate triphosphohydrolase [Thermaurantiacus sp.]MCS6986284.1 deoxyguanosinetriphosphate triphosphohydrolase [Sphingomonadaceae bacterium]MDW8415733.1 deoxyguanosinetriphosphate triphosphohydrolase [Thermaurantiacus sp.]